MNPQRRPTPGRRARRGLSLIEVAISTLLVGLVLVSALKCVGAVVRDRNGQADKLRAEHLAQQLMTEILNDHYLDPGLLPLFGPEAGEPLAGAGPRSGWNDVDDYHLWSASPPQDRNGAELPNLSGWRREATVEWVDPANPANVALLDLGLKRITVTVKRNGVTLATRTALRSKRYNVP